jgi:hypothetical protein
LYFEQDYRDADSQNRRRVAHAPKAANSSRGQKSPFARENRCDGNHMVGISRVAHPE